MRLTDLVLLDEPEDRGSACDLILGEDGRVHYGTVLRRFGATLMDDVICGTKPLRPIGPNEQWWKKGTHRACSSCGTGHHVR